MRTVKVNGILLTEAQLREALVELEKQPRIPNLTRVRRRRKNNREIGVVIRGYVQIVYAKGANIYDPGCVTVVSELGGGNTYATEEAMETHWESTE